MEELDQAIVRSLQALAHDGASASQLLQAVRRELAPEEPHKLTLLKYMKASFGLTLQEASPIAGWSANGDGELSDAQIDAFIGPEIKRHREEWDRVEVL